MRDPQLFPNTLDALLYFSINADIVRLLVSYLEPESLIQCSMINRTWNALCTSEKAWSRWKPFVDCLWRTQMYVGPVPMSLTPIQVYRNLTMRNVEEAQIVQSALSVNALDAVCERYVNIAARAITSNRVAEGFFRSGKEVVTFGRQKCGRITIVDYGIGPITIDSVICGLTFDVKTSKIYYLNSKKSRRSRVRMEFLGRQLIKGIDNLIPHFQRLSTVKNGHELYTALMRHLL